MDPELVGPVGLATVVPTLVVAVAFPLLAALFAWSGFGRRSRALRWASASAPAVAFVTLALHVFQVSRRTPTQSWVVQHVVRWVRVGQFDANLDLAADPTLLLLASVVSAATAASTLAHLRTDPAESTPTDDVAWENLALAGLLLAILGDGALPLVLGTTLVGIALVGRMVARTVGKGPSAARALTVIAAVAFVLVGETFLFWGQGGVWVGGEYTPELDPRFDATLVRREPRVLAADALKSEASIRVDDRGESSRIRGNDDRRGATSGTGYVSLLSYPGALLYVDESHVPYAVAGEVVRAPFSHVPVPGGYHTFRVHPGGTLDDYVVRNLAVGGDRDHALTLFGPTTSAREVKDQLVVVDGRGDHAFANALRNKSGAGPIPLVAWVLGAFALFGFAMSSVSEATSEELSSGSPGLVLRTSAGPVLLATTFVAFAPLANLSPSSRAVTFAAAFLAGVVAFLRLFGAWGSRPGARVVLGAALALAFVGSGDVPSAVVMLAVGFASELAGNASSVRTAIPLVVFALVEGAFTVLPFDDLVGARASLVARILAVVLIAGVTVVSERVSVDDTEALEIGDPRGFRRVRVAVRSALLVVTVLIARTVHEIETWVLGALPDLVTGGARTLAWLGAKAERDVDAAGERVLARTVEVPESDTAFPDSDAADPGTSDERPSPPSALAPILLVTGSALTIYYLLFAG